MKPKSLNSVPISVAVITLYLIVALITMHFSAFSVADKKFVEKQGNYSIQEASGTVLIQESVKRAMSKDAFNFVDTPKNVPQLFFGLLFVGVMAAGFIYVDKTLNGRDIAKMSQDGSAKWLTNLKKFNRDYSSPKGKTHNNGPNNMIMTKEIFINMNTRDTRRNNNVFVIGGSGAGKSRFLIKPNLCEMPLNCSFVCTDPSGELMLSTGKMLEDFGFKIKCFNLVNLSSGNHYNPLEYIKSEDDVIVLVSTILKNTKDEKSSGGEDFWEKSQQMMLQAFISAIWKYGDILEFNGTVGVPKRMETVMAFMRSCSINEKDSSAENPTDKMFLKLKSDLKAKNGETFTDFCLQQYDEFKMGSGKTLKNILISALARLSTFDAQGLRDLTAYDDIGLDRIGDEKTALFIILPVANDAFNFVASMMYTQLFQCLYYRAEKECFGNFLVKDSQGEILKVFEIPHFEDEHFDCFTSAKIGTEAITAKSQKSVKKNLKESRKKEEIEEQEIADNYNQAKIEKKEVEVLNRLSEEKRNIKINGVKKVKGEADDFVLRLKAAEIRSKGDKFVAVIPKKEGIPITQDENSFEIVGVYGDVEIALSRLDYIKNPKIEKLGLRLPYHVRFLMDEFANIGTVPGFTSKLATMRKYEISCTIILQDLSQIKKMYEKDYQSIIGNCDSKLFLGSDEPETTKFFSEKLGKATIRIRTSSVSKGGKGGVSYSYQTKARELMTPDEIGNMDNDNCIFFMRGQPPYYGRKYPYEKHKNFKYTGDADYDNNYVFKTPISKERLDKILLDESLKNEDFSVSESVPSEYELANESKDGSEKKENKNDENKKDFENNGNNNSQTQKDDSTNSSKGFKEEIKEDSSIFAFLERYQNKIFEHAKADQNGSFDVISTSILAPDLEGSAVVEEEFIKMFEDNFYQETEAV